MPTEEELRALMEELLYERPQYETDVIVPGGFDEQNMGAGFTNLPNVGQRPPQKLLREAETEAGELEPIKPYEMGTRGPSLRDQLPPENYMEAYKYGRPSLNEPEYKLGDRYLTPDMDRFSSGGDRVPLSLFRPRNEGRSYLDEDRGGIMYPKLSPGTSMRVPPMYNQGRDVIMEFLRQQLKNYGY
jgi:hypothetical protein